MSEQNKHGKVSITSSFSKTLIVLQTRHGKALNWLSVDTGSYRLDRRETAESIRSAADTIAGKAKEHGIESVEITVKGPGPCRETAIRALQSAGLEITTIKDKTPIPHNGCRPAKREMVRDA